jgi:hypothetical protein
VIRRVKRDPARNAPGDLCAKKDRRAEKGVLGSMLLSPRQAIPECIEKQWEGGYVEVLCNAYHDF